MTAVVERAAPRRMTDTEKLVIGASSLGTVFEWYDFFLVAAVTAEIAANFFTGLDPAPAYIFTTALPPAIAAAARASVRYLKRSSVERVAHQRQAAHTKAALEAAGLPVLATETHIVPVMVGDAELCKAAADHLLRPAAGVRLAG